MYTPEQLAHVFVLAFHFSQIGQGFIKHFKVKSFELLVPLNCTEGYKVFCFCYCFVLHVCLFFWLLLILPNGIFSFFLFCCCCFLFFFVIETAKEREEEMITQTNGNQNCSQTSTRHATSWKKTGESLQSSEEIFNVESMTELHYRQK